MSARGAGRRLAALALVLGSCTGSCVNRCAAPEPLTFRYHLPAPPRQLDPARTGWSYSLAVIDRLFDGLMRIDRVHNVPVPALAASFQISPDGRIYELRLRSEARFHNGRRLVASDVIYSWERLLAPATRSPGARLLDMIDGADAFSAGQAPSVRGLEAVDPDLVRVRLREPSATFLYHLAHPATSIVPREEVEWMGPQFAQSPVGSGPFRFRRWSDDRTHLVLEAFAAHPRPPEVERLVYEVVPDARIALERYRSGELDLVSQLPAVRLDELPEHRSAELRIFPGSAWFGFCFDGRQPPFDDVRIRRALSLAVDRDALVRELGELQYTASASFLPAIVPGQDPSRVGPRYDPAAARRLLAAAGHPGGRGFPPQVYATRTGDLDRLVADFVTRALAELDLPVEPEILDPARLQEEITSGKRPLHRLGWAGGYPFPDPDPFLRPLFHSVNGSAWYRNPDVDALLDLARRSADPADRLAHSQRAEDLILEDAPCVVLYHQNGAVLLRPGWRGLPVGHQAHSLEVELARWEPGEGPWGEW